MPTIVLFHGYGADMNDLAPLAGAIQAPRGCNWYFPNGHLTVPLGGHYEGRAWFPIPLAELEAGATIDLTERVPPGMSKARRNAVEFLSKLNASRLVIGGFSQGAMLATDIAVHGQSGLQGLALLSGTLVNASEWDQLLTTASKLPFYQSHGAYDQVLSFAHAQKLDALLKKHGWAGQLQRFEGGHEIPSEVLIQLGTFLRQVLK